jgi:O-antigen/teichoic acid export membrane protein
MSTAVAGILQLLQIFILARILSPEDFGVISIIMVVVGFSQIFMDMGISNGIIHKQDVTKKQLSTLYWLNVFSGVILYIVLNGLSNFLADFYKMEHLDYYISLLSFGFIIIPFGQQFMILFQKELEFNIIAKVDVLAHCMWFLTTIVLAYLEFGILSFVIGILVFFILRTFLFIIYGFNNHKPELYFKPQEAIFFFKFGMFQLGEKTINYFKTEIDVLIIGKVLGPQSLGLYSVIKQLVFRPIQLVNPIITKVYFPFMSKYQKRKKFVGQIYLNIINSISTIIFPIYLTMFFMSHELIILFLGNQWLEAEMLLKILSLYGLFRSTGNPVGALLMAMGRVDIGFYWNLVLFLIFPFVIYFGSLYGLEGVGMSYLLFSFILFIPNWYFQIYKVCNLKLKLYINIILKVFIISLLASFLSFIIQFYIENLFIKLILFMSVFFIIYISLLRKYNYEIYTKIKGLF